ncbi:AdoMet-dependent rRNA methyltransferase spb1 [Coccidioides immitis H538.4]|uniref:AdoMet-dependent rRNA methyltransferase spb1 n=1 Tax=Coccidioides immitis H538.4 TaxID=396776 RepID=A0A0J8UKE6_COCIT|nr:AdoMet-dependent rRNA methyltransferase spb1 [Coccidioides immitis H538.4]
MAIQKKHGKGRLDKWYKLAKEKGYRARAAFKLIQLNKKYGFLEKSKVLLDLCAAPGSWCQVAAECMPTESLIVGVDLAPIKPIPRVITFQSDITTDKCRATIRQHLKTWKADTVLHDGAPNVGTAWTCFFRNFSSYAADLHLRNPIDSIFPASPAIFSADTPTSPPPKHEAKGIQPRRRKKRKTEGYEERDSTQHKEIPVTEFINTTDPIAMLGTYNTLSFHQSPSGDLALATLERLPETTDEIRNCCEDLKVLGKKEFRTLLRWRLKVREQFGLAVKKGAKKAEESEEVAEIEPMDEELAIQEEMQRLQEHESSRKKKERRRENERKQKEIVRLQMHMITPTDIGMEQSGPMGEGAMFSIKPITREGATRNITSGKMVDVQSEEDEESSATSDVASDDEEDRLERELDAMYEKYQEDREERDSKLRAKKARKGLETEEWEGFSDSDKESDRLTDDDEDAPQAQPGILRNGQANGLSNKAALFFDQDLFQGLGNEDDEEDEEGEEAERKQNPSEQDEESDDDNDPEDYETTDNESKMSVDSLPATKKQSGRSSKPNAEGFEEQKDDPRTKEGKLDIDIITAEAMALAQQMATGEKTSADVVDDGFNKYAFRDIDGLPEWFLDDENKHSKPLRPITAAAAAAIREKMRAINARPIKKVREAKGRKKFKEAQRLEKLKKKSALLAEDEGVSERDKAQTIARMMARATKKKPKQNVKLVVAKGGNRGISGRPRGVKGKYKIVDARLKKDVRAQKRLAKKRNK